MSSVGGLVGISGGARVVPFERNESFGTVLGARGACHSRLSGEEAGIEEMEGKIKVYKVCQVTNRGSVPYVTVRTLWTLRTSGLIREEVDVCRKMFTMGRYWRGRIAQLVRALHSHCRGLWFESRYAHNIKREAGP